MTTFRYLTAEQWGMRWARPPVKEKLGDPEVFVHHTAGSHVNDAPTAFRQLNEYAINSKGYSAVDYDVLVHRDAVSGMVTIGEARGPWMSAATHDRNEQGEAVCLLGYFHPGHKLSRQPHPDEVEGVARGIVYAINKGWAAPKPTILGHKDNPAHPNATGCPGDYLYAQLPTIRTRVAQLLAPPPPEESVINFNLPVSTLNSVKSAPPTADVLANKVDDWWAIATIKALQALTGLPVTGRYDQETGEAINAELAKRGIKL